MRHFHEQSTRKAGGRRAIGAVALVAACVVGPITTVLVAPSASLAATPTAVTLNSGGASVKTSNGDTWSMGIGWVGSTLASGSAYMSVGIIRTVTAGGSGAEIHEWEFTVKDTTLAFNTTTRKGTLNTGTEASPVGTVDLSITGTASKKGTCISGSETIYTVTLKGESEIVTGFKLGGTVGGKTLTFTGTSTLTEDFSCTTAVPCSSALDWGSGSKGTVAGGIQEVISGKTYDYLSVAKSTTLSSPKSAKRDDVAFLEASAGSYNSKTKTVTVSASTAGIVTGSATLTGGKRTSIPETCTSGGKTVKGTLTIDSGATFKSPAGKALTGHTVLTGNLVAPSSTTTGEYIIFAT
jgi:hypothetical protein